VFISVYPFPVPGVWLGVAKMPIHFLTRIVMFISQCITGPNESTFKTPDEMKNASERRRQPASNLDLELGQWGWQIVDDWIWHTPIRRIGLWQRQWQPCLRGQQRSRC
jgi:hypothetical protein